MLNDKQFFTIPEASLWATWYLKRNVSPSNISYLVQYGKVRKIGDNGTTQISKNELMEYYQTFLNRRQVHWNQKLGNDLNWHLSFSHLREVDTTKHVHRLHPYKGKFIPQLVEYFLDGHTDDFKKEAYFQKNEWVLDPFCGSGTTLVQANELGLNAIGVDISSFNAFISNVKIGNCDFKLLQSEIEKITGQLLTLVDTGVRKFDEELTSELNKIDREYFPVPDYKYRLRKGEIEEEKYAQQALKKFLPIYYQLVNSYKIKLKQDKTDTFLSKWYLNNIRQEIYFIFNLIKQVKDAKTKKVLGLILSRTIRSCRATTHADLATLKEPVIEPYYCHKHGKICKPLFSLISWWRRYSQDTLDRLKEFDRLKTKTFQLCLAGDSRTIDIEKEIGKKVKFKGIFTSPPYVGLIDYHEQHAYAYELFGFKREDELEIGPLFKGQGLAARESYVEGLVKVLLNCKKFLVDDYEVFLVANDKYNLYPRIAAGAGMKIVEQFKRPVLNRTERDKGAYSEIIFHLRKQ